MAWGHKPIIENDLDKILVANTKDESLRKKYGDELYRFALHAKNINYEEAKRYAKNCKFLGSRYQDVFYVIDHSSLSGLEKLKLKLSWKFL